MGQSTKMLHYLLHKEQCAASERRKELVSFALLLRNTLKLLWTMKVLNAVRNIIPI